MIDTVGPAAPVMGDNIGKQGFGTVKQTRIHIVPGQFQLHIQHLLAAQTGARQQILMHLYRAIKLTTLAKQAPKDHKGVKAFATAFQSANKTFDRLIGLVIEEIVQADKIFTIDTGTAIDTTTGSSLPSNKETNPQRDQNQREQSNIEHLGGETS